MAETIETVDIRYVEREDCWRVTVSLRGEGGLHTETRHLRTGAEAVPRLGATFGGKGGAKNVAGVKMVMCPRGREWISRNAIITAEMSVCPARSFEKDPEPWGIFVRTTTNEVLSWYYATKAEAEEELAEFLSRIG